MGLKSDPHNRDIMLKTGRIAGNPKIRAISSRASGKTEEGSETRDTTVSP